MLYKISYIYFHVHTCYGPYADDVIHYEVCVIQECNPASALCIFDMAPITDAMRPSLQNTSNNGMLTAAHMCGPAPFSCPVPATS